MATDVIAAMTPAYLTDVLRRAGDLRAGAVVEVDVETPRTTIVSTIARLRLRYAPGDSGPAHVLLKAPRPDLSPELARAVSREVDFYAQVAPATNARVLPRCLEAVAGDEPGRFHVLLERVMLAVEDLGCRELLD